MKGLYPVCTEGYTVHLVHPDGLDEGSWLVQRLWTTAVWRGLQSAAGDPVWWEEVQPVHPDDVARVREIVQNSGRGPGSFCEGCPDETRGLQWKI